MDTFENNENVEPEELHADATQPEEPSAVETEISSAGEFAPVEEQCQPEEEDHRPPAVPKEHIRFEINPPEPNVHAAKPVSAPAKPKKEKKNIGLYVVVALLVVAVIAQAIVIGFSGSAASISDASINDNGELVITYSDGTTDNLGVVVGKDGSNGSNGTTTIVSGDTAAAVAISNGLRSSVSVYSVFTQEGRWGFGGANSTTEYYSAGSGVIYQLDKSSGDAIIITNYHVVYDADSRQENGIAESITVYLYGSEISGMEMEATYVGGSMYYDLAVLYVEGSEVLKNSDAVAVTVADSDEVQVGSTAIAIGNAEGSGISATSGVVSVASEYITMTASDGVTSVDYRVMRIDTAVNSGNSGGGLFDENGCLIGIVNAKTIDDGVENIGYALPSSVVVAVVDNIMDYCFGTDCENVMRPIMGVTVMTTASNAVYDEDTGMLSIVDTVEIYEVDSTQIGSVFQPGDVLVSAQLNGVEKKLTRQYHVIDLMLTSRVGDTVQFTVLRNGEELKLDITITEDCLTAY